MTIKNSNHLDYSVISIEGKLDSNTVSDVEKELENLFSKTNNIIIDLKNLDYISSAGLRIILATAKKLQQLKGKFAIVSMKDSIKELFDIVGFTSILPIYKDLNEVK